MTNSEIEHWMQLALILAQEAANADEVPVGCVLVQNGVQIGSGRNRREETHRTTAHAEIVALESYNLSAQSWRLPESTFLFVTAEPCTMCTGALLWARASSIYFGCADPRKAGLLQLIPLIENGTFDHRFQRVQGGVLEAECAGLMKSYFKAKRHIASTTE